MLDAFAAWLQQGVATHMDGSTLNQSPLVGAALQGLQVRPCLDLVCWISGIWVGHVVLPALVHSCTWLGG